jgi:formylglycine-generating enzyme required for sulfatase activity
MSSRSLFVFVILLFAVCAVSACGQKDKDAQQTENAAVSEVAGPAVVPGEMALIPAGEFIMGTDDKESIAYPQHKVDLPAFWIDKYEVTNSQFLDFAIKTSYTGEGAKEGKDWRLFFTPDKSNFPVVYITWNDAVAYCKSVGKRLPTEEEWEKAARGTDGRGYPWGNDWGEKRANTYEFGPSKPVAIAQFDDISPYGVHDMLGNVQEWTSTWFSTYKGNPKRDPNSGQRFRVVRGLSARYRGKLGHLWDRSAYMPSALYDFGCRCAKDATPEDIAVATQTK